MGWLRRIKQSLKVVIAIKPMERADETINKLFSTVLFLLGK